MKVLVLGGGGREHAIVAALQADPEVHDIVAAPGNPGMGVRCLAIDPADAEAVTAELIRARDGSDAQQETPYDLVVVGPELPLVNGVADAVRDVGVPCFGPSAAAARLEGSKAFAKEVMAAAEVPTALARVCTSVVAVGEALDAFGPPYVVKDDGLAAGKGVVVTTDRAEALAHAQACLAAGGQLVIEEYLDGPEVSLFVLADGQSVVPLAPAQDFKRVDDNDEGPNTGGMGAYSPLPWAPSDLTEQVLDRVARPTILELARRGTPFTGVLYCGLALTSRGLRVVEFNVRFGDPETQAVLARLRTPLGQLLWAAARGELRAQPPLRWSTDAAVAVVLAAKGYPGPPVLGGDISGLDEAGAVPGAVVRHAGTRQEAAPGPPRLVASGGRVLATVGTGPDLAAARSVAYDAMSKIALDGGHYRRDIAQSAAAGNFPLATPESSA